LHIAAFGDIRPQGNRALSANEPVSFKE